ncbi:hypothetical protein [Streptomyces sp. DSM 15324]|uniref:hypothetical protein n=1 Tax=Streptomyces sp. DSM 15324 TaxID=1739111 RepID=UPI00099F1D1C|nr:hypothetical protein [Streptomyces sp. DSM 15324]
MRELPFLTRGHAPATARRLTQTRQNALNCPQPPPAHSTSACGPAYARTDITAVHRSDDTAKTWVRINDDHHRWGRTGEVIVGDPRVCGRVYLATNGRGIQYGEPVR